MWEYLTRFNFKVAFKNNVVLMLLLFSCFDTCVKKYSNMST